MLGRIAHGSLAHDVAAVTCHVVTKQGEVALKARRVADGRDWIELSVSDTGIGMTAQASATSTRLGDSSQAPT